MLSRVKLVRQRIIAYWREEGRHDLPWRRTTDPWAILLAEILLRKTTAQQVLDVYPVLATLSPQEMADADIDWLASVLYPLGLNTVRAKELIEIARTVIETRGALFESDKMMRGLRGIGRYIANSVRCCAFGDPVPAMDTNMIRIMDRVLGWRSRRKRPREDPELWRRAGRLVPKDNPRAFNWGVLDFGSAVCIAKNPRCQICPLSDICRYYARQTRQTSGKKAE